MTSWSQLVNDIKKRPPEKYLTATQSEVLSYLCEALKYPGAVNLYGAVGSGKTYVAWALARMVGAKHLQSPSQIEGIDTGYEILIVDNVDYREMQVRQVLASCNLRNVISTVLITQLPITMRMPRIELPLPNLLEVDFVKSELAYLAFEQSPLPDDPNFWQILRSYT